MREIRLVTTQLKSEIGNKEKNLMKIKSIVEEIYKREEPTLVLFPELFLTSYLMKELVYKLAEEIPGPSTEKIIKMLEDYSDIYIAIGMPELSIKHKGVIYNSVAVLSNKGVHLVYRKRHLPTFGVFDEFRYFKPGPIIKPDILEINGFKIGFVICYDAFFPESVKAYSLMGADIVAVLSAAPVASRALWTPILQARAIENTVYILYSNHVGYMDGLEFFGEAMIISPTGRILVKGRAFEESILEHKVTYDELYASRQIRPIIKDFNYEDLIWLKNAYDEHLKFD